MENESFIAQGRSWMADNGLVDNEMFFQDLLLQCHVIDKRVKNVSFDIDRVNHKFIINIYLNRFWIVFAKKSKINDRILSIALPVLGKYYNFSINYFIYKKK